MSVISSLVIESVARYIDEYATYVSRLGTLVKPGGVVMMYEIENKSGFYETTFVWKMTSLLTSSLLMIPFVKGTCNYT